MSAINWGEITPASLSEHGLSGIDATRNGLTDLRIEVVAATAARAVRSAELKFKYKMRDADAFCIELANESNRLLVTADGDFIPAANDVVIEFLPSKPKA